MNQHVNAFQTAVGQSPNSALAFRDATFNILSLLPGFVSCEKNSIFPVKDEDLPAIRIFYGGERMSSQGQWNQGAPHFQHTVTIWVSVVMQGNSPPVLDGTIMNMAETLKYALLTGYVTSEQDPTIEDGAYRSWVGYCEGIDNFNIEIRYPREGQESLAEIRCQIEAKLFSDWEPQAPDQFREIDIKTQLSDTETLGGPPGVWPTVLERDIVLPQNGIATLVVPTPNPNAGNGTIVNINLGPEAVNGNYVVKMIDPTNFVCYRPPYSQQFVPSEQEITFTFSPGSVPMAAGDRFNITVTGAAQ